MGLPRLLVLAKSFGPPLSQCCARISDLRSSSYLLQSVGLAVFLHEPSNNFEMGLIMYTQLPWLAEVLAPKMSTRTVVRCTQSSTASRAARTFSLAGNATGEFVSPFVSLSTMPSAFPRAPPLGMLHHYLPYTKKLIIPQHSGGGADGSIMIFNDTELKNGANTNLSGILQALENVLSQSRPKNTGVDVSAGDM